MTPDEAAEAARLHAAAFPAGPLRWSAAEIAGIAADPVVFRLARPGAFLLGRVIGPEAELLTLAVDPARRRQGLARGLMAEFAALVRARGAEAAHLEVAEDNAAAIALYRAAGWIEAGRRPRYYRADGGRAIDALAMTLELFPSSR